MRMRPSYRRRETGAGLLVSIPPLRNPSTQQNEMRCRDAGLLVRRRERNSGDNEGRKGLLVAVPKGRSAREMSALSEEGCDAIARRSCKPANMAQDKGSVSTNVPATTARGAKGMDSDDESAEGGKGSRAKGREGVLTVCKAIGRRSGVSRPPTVYGPVRQPRWRRRRCFLELGRCRCLLHPVTVQTLVAVLGPEREPSVVRFPFESLPISLLSDSFSVDLPRLHLDAIALRCQTPQLQLERRDGAAGQVSDERSCPNLELDVTKVEVGPVPQGCTFDLDLRGAERRWRARGWSSRAERKDEDRCAGRKEGEKGAGSR